jgi:ABC-type transporter Mla subunit MlaD
MQTFAHYALPGTILVGGLGAVILCLVLFVYGFRSDPDDEGLSPS